MSAHKSAGVPLPSHRKRRKTHSLSAPVAPQHFLYFLPEPQGQGSFLPTFSAAFLTTGRFFSPSPPTAAACASRCFATCVRFICSAGREKRVIRTVSTRMLAIIASNISPAAMRYSLSGFLCAYAASPTPPRRSSIASRCSIQCVSTARNSATRSSSRIFSPKTSFWCS